MEIERVSERKKGEQIEGDVFFDILSALLIL